MCCNLVFNILLFIGVYVTQEVFGIVMNINALKDIFGQEIIILSFAPTILIYLWGIYYGVVYSQKYETVKRSKIQEDIDKFIASEANERSDKNFLGESLVN